MISVQREDFDIAEQYRALREEGGNAGGIAMFTGLVREFYGSGDGDGKASLAGQLLQGIDHVQGADHVSGADHARRNGEPRVESLTLEHYPGMTEKALAEIVATARNRWDVLACRVIHRVGEMQAGDQIVYVGVASTHRGDAFAAAEFIMDYLKTNAPFWKKQSTAAGSEWIESCAADHVARERWNNPMS